MFMDSSKQHTGKTFSDMHITMNEIEYFKAFSIFLGLDCKKLISGAKQS